MARKFPRKRRIADVLAEHLDDLVERHEPVHAALGHKGSTQACVRKMATKARTLAEQQYKPNPAMDFETFYLRILHQACAGGVGGPALR